MKKEFKEFHGMVMIKVYWDTLKVRFFWMWWHEVRESISKAMSRQWQPKSAIPQRLVSQVSSKTVSSWQAASSHKSEYKGKKIVKMCWTVLPIHPLGPIWLPLISIILVHSKMHFMGQGLQMMRLWFMQWRNAYVIRRTKPGREFMHLLRAG